MPLYEHIVLARQDVSAQQVEELTTALTEVLAQGGGKVTKNEYWGLKSLSYRIKKNRKAHYTLLNIDAPAPAIAEMERQERINEDVLRFLTVRVDALEEGPSAMMQKRDRDDRDDRGDHGELHDGDVRPAVRSRRIRRADRVPGNLLGRTKRQCRVRRGGRRWVRHHGHERARVRRRDRHGLFSVL